MTAGTRPVKVTLRDVAKLAGVSLSSASMALADNPKVSGATKEVVRRAAAQLSYVPNSAGRALRGQRVGALAVVVPHSSKHLFTHPYLMEMLQGISEVASERDVMTILSTSPNEADEQAAYSRILRGRVADGVIVAAAAVSDANLDRVISSGYPLVYVGRLPRGTDVVSVGPDEADGAVRATAHLIGVHKRRRVAHISGPLGHQSAQDKLEGYRTALARHRRPYVEDLVVEGDHGEESGYRACLRLLDGATRPDAIFAANDQMAVGALEALRVRGLDVPGDVALCGFDGIPMSAVVRPSLTTVRPPVVESGRIAVERLYQLIDGELPQPRQFSLPVELVTRQSCGCGA